MAILYLNLALVYIFSLFARTVTSLKVNAVQTNPAKIPILFSLAAIVCVSG